MAVAAVVGLSPLALSGASARILALPDLTNVVQVAAGGNHTCAIKRVGHGVAALYSVVCWGSDVDGQLGDGLTGAAHNSPIAVAVTGLTSIAGPIYQITAGANHTCALVRHKPKCWGAGGLGQLGNDTFANSNVPVSVHTSAGDPAPLSGVLEISAGGNHTCARMPLGRVTCWGQGTKGELGNGGNVNKSAPVGVVGLVFEDEVWAGGEHTCALSHENADAYIKCWGDNADGQLGNGNNVNQPLPVGVSGNPNPLWISAGADHTCAVLLNTDKILCWGLNATGQLGDGNLLPQNTPQTITIPGDDDVWVSAGGAHTCALSLLPSRVECWGQNLYGQLGNGAFLPAQTVAPGLANVVPGFPPGIGPDNQFQRLSAGDNHTCTLIAGGKVDCWGFNADGQLGRGAFSNVAPFGVSTPAPVRS